MSVLSRRLKEKVLFPGSPLLPGAKTPVFSPGTMPRRHKARPKTTAPSEEAPGQGAATAPPHPLDLPLREGLKAASLGLGLVRLQLRAGITRDLPRLLTQVHEGIQALRRQLDGERRLAPQPREGTPPLDSKACELLASCFG